MAKELQFRISSALKDILGRDLITDDLLAIFELVKNSYDAHATKVKITFERNRQEDATLIVEDNGKGMNYEDLRDRWLFLAYSAKSEGTEDQGYRDLIYKHRPFAGAKGIGRLSGDRLGKKLLLETSKRNDNRVHFIKTDWLLFEKDMQEEFIDIPVEYSYQSKQSTSLKHGTIIEISELRSSWDRVKILKLKDSLAKMISPIKEGTGQQFEIEITAPDELPEDSKHTEYFNLVNGLVRNFIFETLGLKTTKIEVKISADGKNISTELFDGGTVIYKIVESNPYSLLLNTNYVLFYLNRAAKNSFTRQMGVQAVNYGTVFLYKNSVRIYPFGEPGEDTLGIDRRKQQGYARFLGTRELIGRIEISDSANQFKETSSREGGLIRNDSYDQLVDCFFEKALKRLERYVVDVQQWGFSIEENLSETDREVFNSKVLDLLAKVSEPSQIISVYFNEDIVRILQDLQSDSAVALAGKLKSIATATDDQNLLKVAHSVERKLNEFKEAIREADEREDHFIATITQSKEKEEQAITENLFLKSIKSQDFQEVVSLLHHIGIYAGTIDNYLSGIYIKVQKGITIPPKELADIIKQISFELSKISSISKFATKANFKLSTEVLETNVDTYLREYIKNVLPSITPRGINLKFQNENPTPLIKKIRPIELNIIVDNLMSNSKKAGAKNILVHLRRNKEFRFEFVFSDDGRGIRKEDLEKIFDFGFTTTMGSGIGLYHVMNIVKSMGGSIDVESVYGKGTSFIIQFQ